MPSMVKQISRDFGGLIFDDFRLLNVSNLTPIMVDAIQTQQVIIDKEIDELQKMVQELKDRLDKIESNEKR